jgi:excisionase family DNA binding protein
MDDLLTTHQVQDILKVDRITIYRMLSDGRIKGVKVGQQWRFARQEVERILKGQPAGEPDPAPAALAGESIFPVHCVQTIQDLFSEVGQVGALVVDEQGEPVTHISHPCAFCNAIQSSPAGLAACQDSWREFSAKIRQGSRFFTCHAGLQYIGAPILDRVDRPVGAFLAGQFYWETPDGRESAERLRRLAAMHTLALEPLQKEAQTIAVIDPAQHARLEGWPFTAARAVQSIMRERLGFMNRLQQIANLTQLI